MIVMEHPLDEAKDKLNCQNLTLAEFEHYLSEVCVVCLLCEIFGFDVICTVYTFCVLCTDSRSSFSGMLTIRRFTQELRMSRRPRHIDLFESVQRNAELLTGNKLKMIVVLFENLSSALLAAQGHGTHMALQQQHQALSRAQRIIKGLQLSLNDSHHPLLGSSLRQLYGYMGSRLWHATVHKDHQAVLEVLGLTRTLLDAWTNLSHVEKLPAEAGLRGSRPRFLASA